MLMKRFSIKHARKPSAFTPTMSASLKNSRKKETSLLSARNKKRNNPGVSGVPLPRKKTPGREEKLMKNEWPQLTLIGLLCCELGIYLVKHGQPRTQKYSIWVFLSNGAILITLLYFGGFF